MKKNSFGQRLAVFLVVIGIFYIIGAISEASEPKCIKSGCDNKQATNSSYCYLHKPYTGSSSSHSSSSYSNKSTSSSSSSSHNNKSTAGSNASSYNSSTKKSSTGTSSSKKSNTYDSYDQIEDNSKFSDVRQRVDRLQEFDKVTYPKDKCLYTNKRFLITEDAVNEQGIMARTMAYLNKLYVDTPVGADIFKVAGGGQNYVHGGTSLQEMMVPVIELTTNTRGVAYDYVDVVLTSVTRKVTNLITYFDFIQTEKVTDTMKARSIVAYFTTEDGEKISFDVPMIANSREDAPEKRTFHEKFTLKSREYKYGDKYYLVLADANDEKNILQQYEFMIDIAFVDDFGF